MWSLLVALVLALVMAVPAFADNDGNDLRTPAPITDVGGPGIWK